ncbi:MAG TPA: dockerin type I repeat-containing protein [Phycisphaerae bacterium]|jgi:hypothetical protein
MLGKFKSVRRAGIPVLLALAASQAARADSSPTTNTTVTISGSTAFASFFQAPGSTNDWIDVNNDGILGFNPLGSSGGLIPFVEQIAPAVTLSANNSVASYAVFSNLSGAANAAYMSVQYRGVGSVNGLVELVNYALNGALPGATPPGNPSTLNRLTVSGATGSGYTGVGGFPVGTPLTSIDAAVLDVTTSWGVQGAAGTPQWNLKPSQAGYGLNPSSPVNGGLQTNQLASLTSGNKSLNLNTAAPNASTIFSTPIAFAPISIASNYGTGLTKVTQTQLQFLYVTGRMADGTNLVAATRDIGSGTRNGAMNSVGVDPSFGTGENIGAITGSIIPASRQQVLGADFQPTNLDATGTMATVLTNSRLSVGYVSTNRGVGDQSSGAYNVLDVKFDLEGGTDYVRPTASTIVNNGTDGQAGTGYRIGGVETFATVGDPLATSINASYPALNSNPQMANAGAAAYIRNIYESVAAYQTAPNSTASLFSPAQTLLSGTAGVPISALENAQSLGDATVWGTNSTFLSQDNSDAAADPSGHYQTGAYGSGSNPFGVVPTRQGLSGGPTYSDGLTQNYRYYNSAGTAFPAAPGLQLNARNAIAGDFSGDSLRNINDIPQLMAAVANPNAWAMAHSSGQAAAGLGTAAIPEILGDFNGDGNFDSKDVRYFADGLAVATTGPNAGHVDRKAAFIAVDDNSSSNYFGTTLATPKPYAHGDSRGDIAGSAIGPNAGAGPTGSDGIVNATDIDYAWKQVHGAMGAGNDGSYATLLSRATTDPTVNVRADLSADFNGDLKIDKSDMDELVQGILGTQYGDANLNGQVTGADYTLLADHFGGAGTWSVGDFNGDGVITGADYTLLADHFGFGQSGAPGIPATGAVPEPASLGALALGALALLRRRRRAAL